MLLFNDETCIKWINFLSAALAEKKNIVSTSSRDFENIKFSAVQITKRGFTFLICSMISSQIYKFLFLYFFFLIENFYNDNI